MSIINEFKEFAIKGNMVDMAVGIIIGGAFGKIVSSLVNDLIMPPVGLIMGGTDFTNLKVTLKEAIDKSPAVTFNYGSFLQTSLDFLILAFCIFLMIKAINKIKKDAPEAPIAGPTAEEKLLIEIRDLLKKQ